MQLKLRKLDQIKGNVLYTQEGRVMFPVFKTEIIVKLCLRHCFEVNTQDENIWFSG